LSSGYFPGVWVLKADVSEHCVGSIFKRWWRILRRRENTQKTIHHLTFYPWGYLKSTVYVTEFSDVQNVQILIQNGFEMIRMTPGIFQRVRQSLFRRAMSCVETRCGHFDHFL
jgi:hypothetical protein